ncbi:MAG: glycine zipper 2TM domain-containing protein [Planctomycetes bacterium]|nr:glycine zipper 2TM domain-containing protein [Planctomycetota bacterium]
MKFTILPIALLLPLSVSLSGCSTMNHTERGIVTGTGLGALIGAVIGHQTGHRGTGAMVGALSGGLIGGLAGKSEDMREERDLALAQADHAEDRRHFVRNAVRNEDLVRMTQSGISDSVIIGSIRSRGGLLDLSPAALIRLKQQGVSDSVIQYAQENAQSSTSREQVHYRVAPAVRRSTIYLAPVIHEPIIYDHHYHHPVVHRPRILLHGHFGNRRRRH